MIDAEISLNGIDPDGESPPDEVIYDGTTRVELVRANNRGTWSLRVYHPDGGYEKHPYGSFEDAFASFAAKVAEAQEATAHV